MISYLPKVLTRLCYAPSSISLQVVNRLQWKNSQRLISMTSSTRFSYKKPEERKTFFDRLLENIEKEKEQSEIDEKVKELHKGAKDAITSEPVQKVLKTYQEVGAEAEKSAGAIKEKMRGWYSSVQKTDLGKQIEDVSKDVSEKAKTAADSVLKQSEKLSQSPTYKAVSKHVDTLLEEMDTQKARGYNVPHQLRKRKDTEYKNEEEKPIEADTKTQDMVLHKDSIWAQSWQKIKENNPMFDKLFDLKTQYDESDHIAVRASRAVTDRITSVFGGMFSQNEMSEVMTEIFKMDPTFTKETFIRNCEQDIIPNILEAVSRGELEILKDWCSEAPYNIFAHSINQWKALGHRHVCKILDLTNVDVLMGKIMEQGPVLIISFQTQQIEAVVDGSGKVLEGDLDKVMRVSYVWALCRDQQELNPKAAWRLMEASVHDVNEQWV